MKHIIIYLLLSLLLLTGCNTEKLNERQKEILAKEGLSTNYDELEYYQKVIIERIEKALVYIEDKYNIPFEYDFYSTGDILFDVNPALYVYPKDNKVEGFLVEIEITKEGYQDNYLDVYSKWPLEEYLIQNIQPLCPNAKMKLILDSYTKLDEIPTDYTKFDGNVSGFALLFIDSSTCTNVCAFMISFILEKAIFGIKVRRLAVLFTSLKSFLFFTVFILIIF